MNIKKYKHFIDLAIEEAKNNDERFKFCAIALNKKTHIISIAYNESTKTHPYHFKIANEVGKPYSVYLHAESSVLIKAKLNCHTLIVVRVKKNGGLANAKPCKICDKIIGISNVKNVIYSNKFGKITYEER